jgi:hypothetical protein
MSTSSLDGLRVSVTRRIRINPSSHAMNRSWLSGDVTTILIGEWCRAFVAAMSGVKLDAGKREVNTVHSASKGKGLCIGSKRPLAKDAENADD